MKSVEQTNTRPPRAILDVLHEAEAKGIMLPDDIDRWWYLETNGTEEGWEPTGE